jgi:hypothetical protein
MFADLGPVDKMFGSLYNKIMEIAIDTLKIFEKLKAADLSEKAAKEIAEVVREASLESQKGFTTKEDILRLENKLGERISSLGERISSIEGEIKLIKWMMGILVAGVMSLVIKAFFMH